MFYKKRLIKGELKELLFSKYRSDNLEAYCITFHLFNIVNSFV